jgi:hypothetical protein
MNRIRGRGVAFLFALCMVTGSADATVRFWLLQDVVFSDGAIAVGSFGYDDATEEVTTWNVRVEVGPNFLPFTYLPGNSLAYKAGDPGYYTANLAAPTILFRSPDGGGPDVARVLLVTPVAALNGTLTSVPLDLATLHGRSGGVECYNCSNPRFIVGGSVVLVPFPPPIGLVEVIEFYHAGFGHYFMSADPPEINALDTGYYSGWSRTGESFKAYATGSSAGATMNPVCRYYGLPSAGIDSHFYSASALECWQTNQLFGTEWQMESDNVFQIDLPNTLTGACPGGTIPVYRVFNQLHDANHRYTTSPAIRAAMEALGWKREGYGPDATIMCAVSP